jgi:hypothetical protein
MSMTDVRTPTEAEIVAIEQSQNFTREWVKDARKQVQRLIAGMADAPPPGADTFWWNVDPVRVHAVAAYNELTEALKWIPRVETVEDIREPSKPVTTV